MKRQKEINGVANAVFILQNVKSKNKDQAILEALEQLNLYIQFVRQERYEKWHEFLAAKKEV